MLFELEALRPENLNLALDVPSSVHDLGVLILALARQMTLGIKVTLHRIALCNHVLAQSALVARHLRAALFQNL